MRYLLVALIIASWGGGVTGAAFFWHRHHDYSAVLMLPVIAVVNSLCAIHLHKRAQFNKIEWGLFGFLANVNAVLIYWFVQGVRAKWDKGERYFS